MSHPVTPKVWGSETLIANREFCGKVMSLREGMRCSLHYHRVKDETFLVTRGRVKVEIGRSGEAARPGEGLSVLVLGSGDSIDVPPLTLHRFTGMEDSEFIEFSTRDDPEDSVRIVPSGPAAP